MTFDPIGITLPTTPHGTHFDLVVVGFGAAGSSTALTAARAGANVVIIEKQPEDAHTPNIRMSMGFMFGVNDVEGAFTYMDRCSGGMIPAAVSRAWVEKAATLKQWHDDMGLDLHLERVRGGEHPFEGTEAIDEFRQGLLADGRPIAEALEGGVYFSGLRAKDGERPELRMGYDYFEALQKAISRYDNITVIYDSPAQHIIRDVDGRVIGVQHGHTGEHSTYGDRGVVLTTGGYEFDEELKLNYLKAYPMHFYGNPGNTGDGVRMAQEVGADLWHMNQMIGRGVGHFTKEDGSFVNVMLEVTPLDVMADPEPGGYVITDKHGKRFANEAPQASLGHAFYYHLLSYDSDTFDYPRIPSYWFFDQKRLDAGPLIPRRAGVHRVGIYDWSYDNRKELAAGWISQGSTIEEAARNAGVLEPEVAAAAVADYNRGCESGVDAQGRPVESLTPLEGDRFYCVPMYPGGSNTSGGPRRNEHAQILDPFGKPIAGLYGAGELGQVYGLLYPAGGSNLSEANCFGRIAAEHALGLSA
ncbi:hypothetical protein DF220_09590 [Salinibacterium hongtaonis]|uniref:FAD-dependent oxidoreductase 2 FAD-binding domain-containing protein n=1 Tax=Homoserinimonas hongtaonis TaxID=2079791 RepID=A0A2U1T2E1_9MICO|nr:hypothetical protein DF220_09590 [Salinibacterium hongtaonis]